MAEQPRPQTGPAGRPAPPTEALRRLRRSPRTEVVQLLLTRGRSLRVRTRRIEGA
jgi:hypothetical protein